VAEYLAGLDAEAQARAEDANKTDDGSGPEARVERKPPKVISPSDPQSAWTAKANKRVLFGYGLNYLVDIKQAVIVDVEATPARTYDEVTATKTMLERTERRFDMKPRRLIADTAYGIDRFLGWLVKKQIVPHIPVWNMSERKDGTFSRAEFIFDKKRNIYVCPAGKRLTTTGNLSTDHGFRYIASVPDCRACMLKSRCCPNMPSRRIVRYVNEDARDLARRKMTTKAFITSRNQRKKVEMRFAHLKTHHGFERLRLRGLSGARDEFHLAAIVQNLKTMALRLFSPPIERRPIAVA
jgi:hypothetical protein